MVGDGAGDFLLGVAHPEPDPGDGLGQSGARLDDRGVFATEAAGLSPADVDGHPSRKHTIP